MLQVEAKRNRSTPASAASSHERAGGVEVHGPCLVRLSCAGRVADDRGEVDDGLGAGERGGARIGVADVAADELEPFLPPRGKERGHAAVDEGIEHADAVFACQELANEHRADIAGSSGDENHLPHQPTCLRLLSVGGSSGFLYAPPSSGSVLLRRRSTSQSSATHAAATHQPARTSDG